MTADKQITPLLLCGGYSTRMGRDKALIEYHGVPQLHHAVSVLQQTCPQMPVLLSCRSDQANESPYNQYASVIDTFNNIGPMGGLASVMQACPTHSFLVLACDMPDITPALLNELLAARDENQLATVFSKQGKLEPLCAIYEAGMLAHLLTTITSDDYSLQRCLNALPIKRVIAQDPALLKNINTPIYPPI